MQKTINISIIRRTINIRNVKKVKDLLTRLNLTNSKVKSLLWINKGKNYQSVLLKLETFLLKKNKIKEKPILWNKFSISIIHFNKKTR